MGIYGPVLGYIRPHFGEIWGSFSVFFELVLRYIWVSLGVYLGDPEAGHGTRGWGKSTVNAESCSGQEEGLLGVGRAGTPRHGVERSARLCAAKVSAPLIDRLNNYNIAI